MKTCTKCGQVKPFDEFYRAKGGRDGYRGDCKACFAARKAGSGWYRRGDNAEREKARVKQWQEENRERYLANRKKYCEEHAEEIKLKLRASHLMRKYGLTVEQYDGMLAKQGGVCLLCGAPPTEGISLHVDHDHTTGEIRGLLCFKCNNALGDYDDDADRLRKAADYLDGELLVDPAIAEAVRVRITALIPA